MFILSICFGTLLRAAPACQPFRPSLANPPVPPPPEMTMPPSLPEGWEKSLLMSIDSGEGKNSFSKIYLQDKISSQEVLSDRERYQWLSCLSYYFNWQRTHSSAPTWTAIVDDRPSRVLYPVEVDQEFGVDPNSQVNGVIPLHLQFSKSRKEAGRLQKKLFQEYGILAVDHTDQHSAAVLKELLFLLHQSFGKNLIHELPSLRYLYAFVGHDAHRQIAAYHHQMKAVSVGGISSYPAAKLSFQQRFNLIAALAHEVGHAFLFDHIEPVELKTIASEYGHWQVPKNEENPSSLFSPIFFHAYQEPGLEKNLPTQYAATNIHEWFADSFAAKILIDLVDSGSLGKNAHSWLTQAQSPQSYWTNYKNLSMPFKHWLSRKIADVRRLDRPSEQFLRN